MKKRLIIITIILIIIGLGSWTFIKWANSPVRQQISIDSSSNSPSVTNQDIATDFFTTKVPGNFRIQVASNPTKPEMVQLTAFEQQGGSIQIGITSTILPSDNLQGIPDYLFRTKRDDLYSPVPSSGFDLSNPSFENKGGDEVTTFVIHNDRYASITISGKAINSDEIASIRLLLAENWRWL